MFVYFYFSYLISRSDVLIHKDKLLNPEKPSSYHPGSFHKIQKKIPRKTNISRRISPCLSTYLLFLSDLPLHGNNLCLRTALHKGQDIIQHTVRLSSMSHYARHTDHNRLVDVLLTRFGRRYSIPASYLSQQTFYHHSFFL